MYPLFRKVSASLTVQDERVYTNLNTLIKLQFRAKAFSLMPNQPINSTLNGRHGSKIRGRGLNFEELRHYHPGDDIRTLDWKVTNRTKKPHVRLFTEERQRNVILLIDQRISMFFASQNKMKSVVASEIAALLAWNVIAAGDQVGAVIFNDKKIITLPPKQNRASLIRLLSQIVNINNALQVGQVPKATQLNTALKVAHRCARSDTLIICISDGFGWTDESSNWVHLLSKHNETIGVTIFDECELYLPQLKNMVITDGSQQISISTFDKKLRHRFTQSYIHQSEVMQRAFKKVGAPLISISTDKDTSWQLTKALGGIHA
ncbi:DUF58 domain-containing protein [Vibrio kyushuensis]|uniref:DUF58 domain-containing protein n=1 Tax=Vibrio kyushuensis TaxID=2910249 RepID=UPI003D10EBB9